MTSCGGTLKRDGWVRTLQHRAQNKTHHWLLVYWYCSITNHLAVGYKQELFIAEHKEARLNQKCWKPVKKWSASSHCQRGRVTCSGSIRTQLPDNSRGYQNQNRNPRWSADCKEEEAWSPTARLFLTDANTTTAGIASPVIHTRHSGTLWCFVT